MIFGCPEIATVDKMPSVTMSLRVPNDEERIKVSEFLKKLASLHPDVKNAYDALMFLKDLYDKGFNPEQESFQPQSIQDVIHEVGCDFLRWEGNTLGFMCYEKFHDKKKGDPIGSDGDDVKDRCYICEVGKQAKLQKKFEAQLMRRDVKGLLDLRKILFSLSEEGGFIQIYICRCELKNHKIAVSLDGHTLKCPLEKDQLVSIQNHCYDRINPKTMQTPCEYLLDPHVKGKMESQEANEIIKQLSHRADERATTKKVESEQTE